MNRSIEAEMIPAWLSALLEQHGEAIPRLSPDAELKPPPPPEADSAVVSAMFDRLARLGPLQVGPAAEEPPPDSGQREIVWNPIVRQGLARLSHEQQAAIERAIQQAGEEPTLGHCSVDQCDAFREVVAGGHKVFYLTKGDRLEIMGLRRLG